MPRIENYFVYAKKLSDAAGAGNLEAVELVLLMAAGNGDEGVIFMFSFHYIFLSFIYYIYFYIGDSHGSDSEVSVAKFVNLPPHGQNYGRNAFHLACQMGH